MSDNRPFVVEFGSKVFLPSLAAAAGISMLILYVFSAMLRETETMDSISARQAGTAVLEAGRRQIETLVEYNAHWNEARELAAADSPSAWFSANWGAFSSAPLYDAALVIAEDGSTRMAAFKEDPSNRQQASLESYFGPEAAGLLEKLGHAGTPQKVVSGFLKTPSGVSVVAAANVHPPGLAATGKWQPLRLILAKQMDKAALAELARPSSLTNLRFVAPGDTSVDGVDVLSLQGASLARLTWTKPTLGAQLDGKFRPIIWAVLILFLMVTGFLVYFSWRGFAQAHQNRIDAVNAALRDELTGLANRRRLMAVLTDRLDTARRTGDELAVVYADLDGFKEVNDAYGHEIGDQLLRAVAAGFQFLAGRADAVARLGGDEFAIILSGPGARDQARSLATNMTAFLSEPMTFGGRIASVTVSAGIVDFEPGITEIEEILRRADIAMYEAKNGGRDRVHIYDASLDHDRDEARAIARELRQAIDEQKLQVVYQPIVDARTRLICGAEALVRWPADSRRLVGPDVFVPIAEKFGLIEELGQFVLETACRKAKHWPGMFVSVNVSPIQFMNPTFAENVARTMHATGLPPEQLELEVTEGFVIDNADRAAAIIEQLHRMHVKMALDDFGTGYSSIGHLRRFRFDKLKLDRSMVSDILRQPAALRLLQGTVAMADALGLRVTAEGVEDENQVPVLRLAGCNLFQGYLFSRPVEARRLTEMLRQEMMHATA